MTLLLVGLALFLGIHSIGIFAEPWRARQLERFGDGPWKGVYSLVAGVGLAMLMQGYADARHAAPILWAPLPGARAMMPFAVWLAFVLFAATYFPGRIRALVRHPSLAAVLVWAGAHLTLNGSQADALLFGGFAAWALLDWISFSWRAPRVVPAIPANRWNDVLAVGVASLAFVAFREVVHLAWIGVPAT